MNILIDESFDGKTVKAFCSSRKYSTRWLARLKRLDGGITVNGSPVTVCKILRKGDLLSLNDRDEIPSQISPFSGEVDILYEDDFYLAVNKGPFLPVHPSRRHQTDTLASRLAYRYRDETAPFVFRCLTRLDADTSGLVLLAKDRLAASLFSKMLSERSVEKTYLAFVTGKLSGKGEIRLNIRRPSVASVRREAVPESEGDGENGDKGMPALTRFCTLASNDFLSLCEVMPETGRTHQIRVHMAAIGHPLVGDTLYGQASDLISRQALHACRLQFRHPFTGKETVLSCPLPDDMTSLLTTIGDEHETPFC